ncbi:polysaccharide deacetylase family protein [Clostridium sp. YIM B02505]|uniref:Polysaccharide deacetylase family protein n=1 Tax=Clostridium yunnanense TaxID=2800325 RepID=A0ABS1ENG4_9CLOT|nr:polysaccharide deacetylase family protein [Clostridium yunnanense]MBK1810916.1 polysaccharide deacetylase family protein [Clostridium yunnanense]
MIEEMGYKRTDKLLIINADDFGIAKCINEAIIELFNRNDITSTSVMMPGSRSKEIKDFFKRTSCKNVGIHLTLTDKFKPVSRAKDVNTLIMDNGIFPSSSEYIESNGDINHVKKELRNQIELALSLGIDPTHLDSHQGSVFGLFLGRDFMEVVFELCMEYGLPFLLPKQVVNQVSFDERMISSFKRYIRRAKELGIALIDDVICLPYELQNGEDYKTVKNTMINKLTQIQPGITQVTIHPSFVTKELKEITLHWQKREMEYNLFLDDDIKRILLSENIKLISWKEIREYQRSINNYSKSF